MKGDLLPRQNRFIKIGELAGTLKPTLEGVPEAVETSRSWLILRQIF